MNEIDQLKAEHARYRKALEKIHTQYGDESDAYYLSDAALNPPPLPPVTLPDLQAALLKAEDRTGDFVALLINKDGSGNFRLGCHEIRGKKFSNLHEALAMLLSDKNLI